MKHLFIKYSEIRWINNSTLGWPWNLVSHFVLWRVNENEITRSRTLLKSLWKCYEYLLHSYIKLVGPCGFACYAIKIIYFTGYKTVDRVYLSYILCFWHQKDRVNFWSRTTSSKPKVNLCISLTIWAEISIPCGDYPLISRIR